MRRKITGCGKSNKPYQTADPEALTSLARRSHSNLVIVAPPHAPAPEPDSAGTVVLDYPTAVVEFSITTREALSNLPACSWPRL